MQDLGLLQTRSSIELSPEVPPAALWAMVAALALVYVAARWRFGPPCAPARLWRWRLLRACTLLTMAAILANPVRVEQSPGVVEKAKVVYLLDASRSMGLAGNPTRWDEACSIVRTADDLVPEPLRPERSLYRFGERLSALDATDVSPASAGGASGAAIQPGRRLGPTDGDTQLAGALRDLTSRFGRVAPRAVALFSDGQARDHAEVDELARRYGALGIPIHTVTLGGNDRVGDVAVVGVVVPSRVRKHSRVSAHVSVRSYGFVGRRTELVLLQLGEDGRPERTLARLPITLAAGLQSFETAFQADTKAMRIQASIPPQPNEVAADNNAQTAEIAVDRTKIRVLYLEGNRGGPGMPDGARMPDGSTAGSLIGRALTEDPDIECATLVSFAGARGGWGVVDGLSQTFPESAAELYAYDVLVLSNIPAQAIERGLDWLEPWVARRGGGICFVGGPDAGLLDGWKGTPLESMLPVTLDAGRADPAGESLALVPAAGQWSHPIWTILGDQAQNRDVLGAVPPCRLGVRFGAVKPQCTLLATARAAAETADAAVAVAVGPYGKGRSMAVAPNLDRAWARRWGDDARYFAKFWRNAVYWLSENSSYGRRRLIAAADKILYRPGESILLSAAAFDEAARPTDQCRVVAAIEPRGADAQSEYSPLRWPVGVQRPAGEQGPLMPWSTEIPLRRRADGNAYDLRLPITENAAAVGAAPAVRLEISAYEGATLIDSSSVDLQILDDPPELQNPLCNPQLMGRVASLSGGRVVPDAAALAAVLRELPHTAGEPVVRKTPLWDSAWVLTLLIGLLTLEWIGRRSSGLA